MSHSTAARTTPNGVLGVSAKPCATTSSRATDVRVVATELYFLPVKTRVPLKFGSETLTSVTCARARVTVVDRQGKVAVGWGETPLNVEWVWPSSTPYTQRHEATKDFCRRLAERWANFEVSGHPLEVGHAFQEQVLAKELEQANQTEHAANPAPLLASLLCCTPFDLALYDAYGKLHNRPVFETFTPEFMSQDLANFLEPAEGSEVSFAGEFPQQYLVGRRADSLLAWHLVGGLDPLAASELTEDSPADEHPLLLEDWIARDGLECLKIKLRGTDFQWDYDRIVRVGQLAQNRGAKNITADFNCTVKEPAYVVEILDKLAAEHPEIYDNILYIEQPFPYDLEAHRIDVHEVSRRKPLLMDESAHNWRLVRLGRSLGWNGVALKTCKTLTGAILTLCWAKAHGMAIMVQDLTNPMLAQIPHVLLAAHIETLLGVETNAMQFYPSASAPEAKIHPGLYQRREGRVDLTTLAGPGFGYRIDEIERSLPEPAAAFTSSTAEATGVVPRPHIEVTNPANQ